MPWEEREVFEQRCRLIELWKSGMFELAEVARMCNVSERTLLKWRRRYEEEGKKGLRDRSRRPNRSPNSTSAEIVERLLLEKSRFPKWGPKKIRDKLVDSEPETPWPARSTVEGIFKRNGLVKPRRFRRRPPKGEKPSREVTEPNQLMTVDFKGDFLLGNKKRCYPLTVADERSRFVFSCLALPSVARAPVQIELTRVFRESGMPDSLLTDNGTPFASKGLRRFSRFGAWLIELGINHVLSRPASPQDNGRHERMHRTLRVETEVQLDFTSQQGEFDRWRGIFNFERPHEGIDGKPPARVYRPSTRSFPEVINAPDYSAFNEIRTVCADGRIKFKGQRVHLSEAFAGKRVALLEVEDQIWAVYFYNREIGRFSEAEGKAL